MGVLNVKDRVTEYRKRFKLKDTETGQEKIYDLEQVTGEISEVGTPINKELFDKVENVLSYQVPGVEKEEIYKKADYSQLTDLFNGTMATPEITLTLKNENIVVGWGGSSGGYFRIYSKDGTEIKRGTLNTSPTYSLSITLLQNGNFVIAYRANSKGMFKIYNEDGEIVKDETIFKDLTIEHSSMTTLKNGNFVIAYANNDDKSGEFVIYSENGTLVQSAISIFTPAYTPSITSLSNGNFVIVYGTADQGIFKIYNENGGLVKETVFSGYSYASKVLQLSNNDIMIAYNANKAGNFVIYSENGEKVIKDATSFYASGNYGIPKQVTNLFDGNVLLVYLVATSFSPTSGSLYYVIYKNNGVEVIESDAVSGTIGSCGSFSDGSFYIMLGSSYYIKTGKITNYYKNFFYLSNALNDVVDGQRVLINTPQTEGYAVGENAINGIEIKDILLPNQKYELIYENGVFDIFRNDRIIYDITTEIDGVQKIALNGIRNKLKANKLYVIHLYGKINLQSTETSAQLYFGTMPLTSATKSTNKNVLILTQSITNNWQGDMVVVKGGTSGETGNAGTVNDAEYIELKQSTKISSFQVGFRIVIREVC